MTLPAEAPALTKAEAQRVLARMEIPARIFRVYEADDPLAWRDSTGVGYRTILFCDVVTNAPVTAVCVDERWELHRGFLAGDDALG